MGWLAPQDFLDQIVQHEMVAAGEGLDEVGGVLVTLHRNRGQLQSGNPAFGPVVQDEDDGVVECGDLIEQDRQDRFG